MDPILDIIPAEKISSTPVYIYATAGMRLLKEEERNAILSEACSYLKKNYNFLVTDCKKQIVNISGEEEGLYGWLGLNYLKNGFSGSGSMSKRSNSKDTTPSYGVLDMGGASTQIAYDISSFIKNPNKDEENVLKTELHKISGEKTTYNVYSTTFLGFGMNETRRRYLEELIKKGIDYVLSNFDLQKKENNKRSLHIDKKINAKSLLPNDNITNNNNNDNNNNKNYKRNSTSKSPIPKTSNDFKVYAAMNNEIDNKKNINSEFKEIDSNIIDDEDLHGKFSIKMDTNTSEEYYELIINDPCLPINAMQNEFKPIDMNVFEKDYDVSNWRIDLKGAGDLEQCMSEVYPFLNKTVPCTNEPCLFNGVHSPVVDFSGMPFYGISEYWYTSHDVHKQGGVYNYEKFYAAAKDLCKSEWSGLDENYKNGDYPLIYDEYLLFLSCFRSAWIMTVLHDGIGITKKPTFDKREIFDKRGLMNFENTIEKEIEAENGNKNENELENQDQIQNIDKKEERIANVIRKPTTYPDEEELVPFTTINEYNGYQVSWTLGVILNYISSTISETLEHIDMNEGKKVTMSVFLFGSTSLLSFSAIIALILYTKYGNHRLEYTEILPVYDDYNGSKIKNRYREVISLDSITSKMPKMKPSENFNNSSRAINSNKSLNPKVTNVITNTKELPFRVSSDLQQYLSGEGTPNELKRVNSFTSMKKDSQLV